MVDWVCLESICTFIRAVGSNPILSSNGLGVRWKTAVDKSSRDFIVVNGTHNQRLFEVRILTVHKFYVCSVALRRGKSGHHCLTQETQVASTGEGVIQNSLEGEQLYNNKVDANRSMASLNDRTPLTGD